MKSWDSVVRVRRNIKPPSLGPSAKAVGDTAESETDTDVNIDTLGESVYDDLNIVKIAIIVNKDVDGVLY